MHRVLGIQRKENSMMLTNGAIPSDIIGRSGLFIIEIKRINNPYDDDDDDDFF